MNTRDAYKLCYRIERLRFKNTPNLDQWNDTHHVSCALRSTFGFVWDHARASRLNRAATLLNSSPFHHRYSYLLKEPIQAQPCPHLVAYIGSYGQIICSWCGKVMSNERKRKKSA